MEKFPKNLLSLKIFSIYYFVIQISSFCKIRNKKDFCLSTSFDKIKD